MLASVQYGISVAQIYRAANNPLIDRMIARFRSDRGEFIPVRPALELERGLPCGSLDRGPGPFVIGYRLP
jgi:lauroyl/myristoyl acyltransferase